MATALPFWACWKTCTALQTDSPQPVPVSGRGLRPTPCPTCHMA